MGTITSKCIPSISQSIGLFSSRKRKYTEDNDSDGEVDSEIDPSVHVSKR